jgi:hypothetical protein
MDGWTNRHNNTISLALLIKHVKKAEKGPVSRAVNATDPLLAAMSVTIISSKLNLVLSYSQISTPQ